MTGVAKGKFLVPRKNKGLSHSPAHKSIEYRSDDITKKLFFAFQRFGYHVSVEHDEKHPQPKFGGNPFMGTRDMAA